MGLTVTECVRRLWELGHAPECRNVVDLWANDVFADFVHTVFSRYQRFHGLPITGGLSPETVGHLGQARCAHPDVMADTGLCRWPIASLRYYQSVAYPGVDPARVARNYAQACAQIEAVCGITLTASDSPEGCQILATSGAIDGPWNVLALSELPCGATAQTVLHQTFDVAEQLSDPMMVAMMCHELCHALGLGHSGPGNLMAPVLDVNITAPQLGDISELQARCGPPAAPASPPLPPATSADADDLVINFTVPTGGAYTITLHPTLTKRDP